MAREIKTVFALDGETRYRDAIKGINREMALLRAEMRASDNAFDTSGDKQQKLSTRAESLARQIELQKKKVEEAQNAVEQANRRYEEASAKLEEMRAAGKESTDEFKKQQQEVERAEKALTNYKIDVANAESSLGKMQTQLANTNKEILLNESRMKKAGDAMTASSKKAEKLGKTLTTAGNKLTVGLTLPIVAAGAASIKAAIDFESAFAGVRKTVEGTEEQMAALEQGIRDMAKEIPATTTEISAVAEAAGQLGIETDNVLEFTRVMIDLGETTNLSAEEGAAALAKFANVTQMSQDDFDRLGSVIVALGNNMATTEADIVAMGTRLAGAGRQVGMTEPQIMSFAAALSSVGIEAEAGGSAFSKVMVEIQLASEKGGAKLKQFANVAGMSAEEFRQKFETDAAGAIMAFVEGLGNMEGEGKSAIGVLEDMGITEVRMRDALLRSANAGDLLAEAIGLGNEAWDENNALTKEAAMRYETTESKLKIAKNTIADAGITVGENLLPPLADLAKGVADIAEGFGDLSPEMQKTILIAAGVVAAIGPVTRTMGTLANVYSKISGFIGKYLVKLAEKKAAEVASAAVTTASAAATTGATAATTGATAATAGFGAASASALVPLLAIVAALAAFGIAAYAQKEHFKTLNKGALDAADAAAEFSEGIDSAKSALEGFQEKTALSAERQTELKDSVKNTQGAITELTDRAVSERRALTEAEYERLQKLIDQLGVFAEAQIEVYEKQNRILARMIENEDEMTEARAQELIKGANETAEALIGIEQEKYSELYNQADEFDQKAAELRAEGYAAEAEDWESKAADLRARAEREHGSEIERINREMADVISLVQQKYIEEHAEEVAGLTRIGEIQEERVSAHEKYLDELKRISRDETLTASQKHVLNVQAMTDYQDKLRELNAEEVGLWDEKTSEVAGALAVMAADIEMYGGIQSEEAQKATNGIILAWDKVPDDLKGSMKESLEKMIEELKEKSPDLYNEAKNTSGSFVNRVEEVLYGATGTYADAGEKGGKAYVGGFRSYESGAKRAGKDVKDAAVGQLKTGEDPAGRAGEKAGGKYAGGIRKKRSAANEAAKSVKDATLSPFNVLGDVLESRGASGASKLARGVKSGKGKARDAAGVINDAVKTQIGKLSNLFENSGISGVRGLIRGLQNTTVRRILIQAARALAYAVNRAYNNAQDIKSPSGVMEKSGVHDVEGVIEGIRKKTPDAKETARKMARAVAEGYASESDRIVAAQAMLERQIAGPKLSAQLAYSATGMMHGPAVIAQAPQKTARTDQSTHITVNLNGTTIRSDEDVRKLARELMTEADRRKRAKGA